MSIRNNATNFAQALQTSQAAQEIVARLAKDYTGDRSDDRAVYQEILSPAAAELGIDLSFEEALGMGAGAQQLTDEQLDAVAGGVGSTVYQRVIAGVLTGVMLVGAAPSMAIAAESNA